MKNLLITHDIFRSRDFGMISTVENLHWIKALLKLCGRGVFHKFSTLISTADNGPIDVSPLMKQLDLPPTVESWARLVSDADLLPALINFFDSYLEDITHAFGFGLTPNFMHVLQNRGISFVDIELSPIRFSKGINFRARTNCASFHNVLQALQYPEQHHLETAMRATGGRSRKIMPSSVKRGIFTGQAQIDLAIVENSKIRHPWDEDVINGILNLTEDLDELHIIPHPMQLQRIGHLIPILHHIPKAIFSKADTYSLLTHPDTTRVISLSSGTLKESSFLGIEACALIKPDRDNSALLPSGLSEWIEVRDQLFSKETITAFSQNKNIPELNFSNKNDMMGLIESTFGENKRTLMTTPNYEEAPRLSAGLRYDVVSGKIFHDILHFGWSSVEDWGVWSDGPIAELNFKISSHSGTTLTLKGLTFGRKIGEKYFSPIVTAQVVVDGKTCAAHFAYNDSAWDLTSEIPPSLQDTAVYVHFFVSGACSPRLLSINDDPRKIGLGLTEVTLSKANVTAAIDGQHQDSNYYVNAHREIRGYQENN